jgi:hypothetical protein
MVCIGVVTAVACAAVPSNALAATNAVKTRFIILLPNMDMQLIL